jgi:hypothetical protein
MSKVPRCESSSSSDTQMPDWKPWNEVWARIARTGSGVTTTTGGRTVSSPPQLKSAAVSVPSPHQRTALPRPLFIREAPS